MSVSTFGTNIGMQSYRTTRWRETKNKQVKHLKNLQRRYVNFQIEMTSQQREV